MLTPPTMLTDVITDTVPSSSPAQLDVVSLGAEWLPVRAGGLNRYTWGLSHGFDRSVVDHRWVVMGDQERCDDDAFEVAAVASPQANLLARWWSVRNHFKRLPQTAETLYTSHFALYAYPVVKTLRERPHVVHFHGPWADESSTEGAGWLAAKAKHRIESAVYRSADRFIVLSRAFADLLAENYRVDESRIRIVPGGVEVSQFDLELTKQECREELGWPCDRPIVFCVRRLAKRMGLERLIEALQQVVKTRPDVLLLIGGRGQLEKQLKAQIRDCGLSAHVRLIGFVPEEHLAMAYRAADLSIVPTESLEGFGLITLESLAAGTPVLVSPVGGLPETVSGLSERLIMDGSSVADLAAALEQSLSGERELPTAEECLAYVQRCFDWRVIASQVAGVYREVASE